MDALQPKGRSWVAPAIALGVIFAGAGLYRWLAGPGSVETAASASASAAPSSSPRCSALSPGKEFRVGPSSSAAAAASSEAGEELPVDRDDLLAPFAVVVGDAVAHPQGWALGVLGDADGGSAAFVVSIDADGGDGRSVRLGRSRGDMNPPVVVASADGATLYAALLEPQPSTRALRLAAVQGERVTWGAELPEGDDESLAIDLAVNAERGLVAWDGFADDKAFVSIATFSLADFSRTSPPRRVTVDAVDADSPRVAAHDRGFYLAYLVHAGETRREAVGARGAPARPDPPKAPAPLKKKVSPEDEVDEARGGESIGTTWIEVVPIDDSGVPASAPLRVTPEGATVTSFDLGLAADGSLTVAYRDDDAPVGGIGGHVRLVRVHAGGLGPSYDPQDPLPSDGVPSLLAGWLAIPTLSGPDLLAKLGPDGLPIELPTREPSLGLGEPIAARADQLLLADPAGRAMKFRVVTCGLSPPVAPAPPEPEE